MTPPVIPTPWLDPLRAALPGLRATFLLRDPAIPVTTAKEETLARLLPAQLKSALALGFSTSHLHLAEQIHGAELALAKSPEPENHPRADGLITTTPGIPLGIHVADCGAVFLLDPETPAIALLHSGKKGTELEITTRAIQAMIKNFGTNPAHLHLALAPCIRPPHYEIDFATEILAQARRAGLKEKNIHDSKTCTASDLTHHYSYRAEKGKTGRHLALLQLPTPPPPSSLS